MSFAVSSRVHAWSRPAVGLAAAALLVLAAALVPVLLGIDVQAGTAAPLLADWRPRVGLGTLPALVIAWLAVSGRVTRWSGTLPWRRLLVAAYALSLGWLLSLALVDGAAGIADPLDADAEYLPTARSISDVGAMLAHFVARIPFDAPDAWATHVAGHPPGALLVFVGLDRIGLGSGLAAGLVVVLVSATIPVAVAIACRTLGAEDGVRRALPFLVVGPAAIWLAVSADGVFSAVAAWGLAALALTARAALGHRGARALLVGRLAGRLGGPFGGLLVGLLLGLLAGLLLGWTVLLSYGLLLLGVVAVGVLVAALPPGAGSSPDRSRGGAGGGADTRVGRTPSPAVLVAVAAYVAAVAAAVALAFAAAGFRYWEALPALHDRYYAGLAQDRPAWYWVWGNLAVLAISAGPALAAAVAEVLPRGAALLREREPLTVLATSSALALLLADASLMSKAETERIWLPFVPWLLLLTAHLPEPWRRRCLVLQVAVALVVQHVLWSRW